MNSLLKKITGVNYFQDEDENKIIDEEINLNFNEIEDLESNFEINIDVYQDDKNVFLRTFIPGISPDKINIDITRDIVQIDGERVDLENVDLNNFHQRELQWGKFSKKILLPHEVEVDKVKANFSNGMLILKMPKLDKDRSVKVSLN